MGFSSILRWSIRLIPYGVRGRIRKLPFVAHAQRWLVNRFLDGKPFVHSVDAGPARGITFELVLPEDKSIWTGTYETAFAERLAEEMRPGMVCYDIGSWHGYFAGIMLAQGAVEVVMFEPLPDNRERLERFVKLNPNETMRIEPVALGDRDDTAILIASAATSMARLSDSPFGGDVTDAATFKKLKVSLRKLDGYMAENGLPTPDILKIDVEGAEAMVLRGAESIISSAKPIVLAEIHSAALMTEVREILERHDYVVETINAPDLRRATDSGHICAHPSGRTDN